ncbi:MAG TPA: CYTH and CHAD domain-containing protein [Mycobacteriales bacterium]
MREIERKYEVPADFRVPAGELPDGVVLGEPAEHTLTATYYDTPDLRLARDRVTLRRRTGGKDDGWHVKRPVSADERDELQLPLGRSATVPARVSAEVRALTRGGRLVPVLRLSTVRTEWPLVGPGGEVLATVADDKVSSTTTGDQPSTRQWREVEVELAGGDRSLLKAVDRTLRGAGAVPSSSPSKLARGLDGQQPDEPAGPPEGTAAAAAAAYLREQRDALVGMDPRVRRDEPDAVHKMRVATRRARSTLKTFRPLWDRAEADRLRGELKWLAEVLGGVRDAEVLAARLKAALDQEPPELVLGPVAARLVEQLRGASARHRRTLIAALDGPRYATLLDDLDALLRAPVTERGAQPAEDVLRTRVRRVLREVDQLIGAAIRARHRPAGSTAQPLPGVPEPDEALHEARKAAKRARYAAEAAGPVSGKPARAVAAAMEQVQELLGGHQDSVVTRSLLRDAALAAHKAGEPTFTYGRLHAAQEHSTTSVDADLTAARKAYRTKKIRGWLG